MGDSSAEIIIPYFYFDHLHDRNTLRLNVCIDSEEPKPVVSELEIVENEVIISSKKYKNQKRCLKIFLPAEVIRSIMEADCSFKCLEDSYYYEWRLNEDTSKCLEIKDLDLISCHLSWHENAIREKVDSLTPQVFTAQTADDVTESLETLSIDDATKSRLGLYGFACRYTKALSLSEMTLVDLKNPDHSDPENRILLRWENEDEKFDVDHYLADFFFDSFEENDMSPIILRDSISYKPYWHELDRADGHRLTSNQMAVLATLPCKKFNLSAQERLEVLHSLLDIILAFVYDIRITEGQHNCESGWNISKLSATLSWFQVHKCVNEAVTSFFRRSIIYPFCRCWILSMAVYVDALEIFRLGRRQILNCLIEIYTIFDADEDRRFLNELYIKDYLIWIQQVHPNTIQNYLEQIYRCKRITKEYAMPGLSKIEESAINVMKDDKEGYRSWLRSYTSISKYIDTRWVNEGASSESSSNDSSEDSSEDSPSCSDVSDFDGEV